MEEKSEFLQVDMSGVSHPAAESAAPACAEKKCEDHKTMALVDVVATVALNALAAYGLFCICKHAGAWIKVKMQSAAAVAEELIE